MHGIYGMGHGYPPYGAGSMPYFGGGPYGPQMMGTPYGFPVTPFEGMRHENYMLRRENNGGKTGGVMGFLGGGVLGGILAGATKGALGGSAGGPAGILAGILVGGTVGGVLGWATGQKLSQYGGILNDARDDGRLNGSPHPNFHFGFNGQF